MNWLAHLVLAEPEPMSRVGSLLPDLVPIAHLRDLAPPLQAGIQRHREVDAFTDQHPVFRRSVARLEPPFRRYGAVLIDIFYDHLLSSSWSTYSRITLDQFLTSAYADFDMCRDHIPSSAYVTLRRMRAANWLGSYGDIAGIRATLDRMSQRLRRPFDLGGGVVALEHHYANLHQDFTDFFPAILARFGRGQQIEN
jgi:acyl carrier protein phosphodiesterase